MRRAFEILRSAMAATALGSLVIGLPILLVTTVGWPLPRQVPDVAVTQDALRGRYPLDPVVVWKVFAVVLWYAWLQVAVAAAVEVSSLVRSTLPRQLPGLNLGHALVAPLVATIALAWPGGSGRPAAASPLPLVLTTDQRTSTSDRGASATTATVPVSAESPVIAAPPTLMQHTVVRRDTLWDLAERYVVPGGSDDQIGAAVRQLFELNRGRAQPDGSTLTDVSLIRPGWVLQIPALAAAGPVASEVTVTSGDSLWKIAEEHLGDGDRFDEIFDLNAGRVQPDGGALVVPSRIEPGWVLDLPVESHAAPELPLEHPTPLPQQPAGIRRENSTPVDTTSVTPPPQRVAAPDASETSDGAVDGALGIAGGFLAVGLAGAVRVRRQRQRMRRTPGMELPATPVASAPVVAALVDADLDVSREVVRLVRQLGSALVAAPHVPVPVVVSVHDNHVELLIDRAEAGAPSPWTSDTGGRIWRANLSSGQSDLEEGPPWTPTMTSVGTLDADGLLLNLEAFGSVGLVGDGPSTCGLARSLAVELTSTPFADVPAVHVVADVIGELPDLAGLATHPDLASALAAAEAHTEGIRAALQRSTMDTLAEARCRVPAEAWAPAVVVVSASVGEVALRPLVERASERSGVVAVVVGGCPVGATEIQVSDDELFVPDLGLRCRPQQLSGASLTGITTLLDVYGADPEPPIDDADLALFEAVHVAEPDDEVKLRVNVLGPVTVTGAELSPQQVALVAYLALHNGATADAVRDAVWGGKAPTRERFLNTIHELRRAVGADVLPASVDGRYRLHHVWSDVAELEVLLGEADAVDVSGAGSNLRRVLELVQGPPLIHEGRHRRHFRWVDLGNHASRLERIIGDAAHELAERSLDAGDVDLARWAAQRGLLACPGSEVLTADLVRAHLAAGNRTAAQSVIDEFARVLEDLGDDEPPEALYSLLETRRAS